jgi:transcriptional regulator with XRE-family HTH domain
MDWGQVLHAARRRKRMSQEHLAAAAGVSVRTIRRAERGEQISDESLRSLCATLELRSEVDPEGYSVPGVLVVDGKPHEFNGPAFSARVSTALRVLSYVPAATVAVAAVLVLMGTWSGMGLMPLAFFAAQIALVAAGPEISRRLDEPASAILSGFVSVNLGVQWLINFGAGSPKALVVAVLLQFVAGMAMIGAGVVARNREWIAVAEAEADKSR